VDQRNAKRPPKDPLNDCQSKLDESHDHDDLDVRKRQACPHQVFHELTVNIIAPVIITWAIALHTIPPVVLDVVGVELKLLVPVQFIFVMSHPCSTAVFAAIQTTSETQIGTGALNPLLSGPATYDKHQVSAEHQKH
jgi:hypothetical protein